MTLTAREAAAMLRATDPVRDHAADAGLDGRAEADLRRILATAGADPARLGRPARPRRRDARLLAAAAAVTVVGVALTGVVSGGLGLLPAGDPAYAATPQRLTVLAPVSAAGLPADADAATVLNAIAARTAVLRDDTGSGRYARMENEGWALWTRVAGDQVTSEVVPQRTTVWAAGDGSGRLVSRRDGPGDDTATEDQALGPGGRSFMWPLGSLSADDALLARQLEQGHPVENGPAERLVAVADLVAEQPLSPAVRAAVLRYLARTPGLSVDGIVADRSGRRGVAVHLDTTMSGLPERRTLIVDPDDGRVLGAETMLTEDAGRLNVAVPSVIDYKTFRSGGYTDKLG